MPRVFDVFPFFDELDVLEVRLNELDPIVDKFIICESRETYGGTKRPLVLDGQLDTRRFAKFKSKIHYMVLDHLDPKCTDHTTGRLREAYQRNMMAVGLAAQRPEANDIVIFSDCDEIPRAEVAYVFIQNPRSFGGITRFKQTSYYYNVNTVVDYGHDFSSRARIGTYKQFLDIGTLYAFRMANKDTEKLVLEKGGWHFGYFGDLDKIKRKVAALSPFLSEYKLFGDETLVKDIREGRDLHHRQCELPEQFEFRPSTDASLPAFLRNNLEKFRHFTREGQVG